MVHNYIKNSCVYLKLKFNQASYILSSIHTYYLTIVSKIYREHGITNTFYHSKGMFSACRELLCSRGMKIPYGFTGQHLHCFEEVCCLNHHKP